MGKAPLRTGSLDAGNRGGGAPMIYSGGAELVAPLRLNILDVTIITHQRDETAP